MKEIMVDEFVRRIKELVSGHEDSKFVFFFGAGCSASSGIPTAGELVKSWLPRLKRIKTGSEKEWENWAKEKYGYKENTASSLYGKVIEDLFLTPQERQKEIERLIEGKNPGFGYAVLAQIMAHNTYGKHFNIVLTVNFDDLIADALYLYTNKKPLVITHDSLFSFVRITTSRNLVIKLHGDARLEPKNTKSETKKLKEGVKEVIKELLSEFGIIFVGYGGHDNSIAELFSELPPSALPWGIYWVDDKIPDTQHGKWLKKRENSVWVRHNDFDELMLLFFNEFGLEHPDDSRYTKVIQAYYDTFEKLQKEIESKQKGNLKEPMKEALRKIKDWWSVELEARKYKDSDPDKADKIYQEGIREFPNNAKLLGNYAVLLSDVRKDYDEAERYYKKALEAEPNNAINLGNYANFLSDVRKDYDEAERYYKKALEAEPNDAINLGNYAGFLLSKGEYETGFKYLETCMRSKDITDPTSLPLECYFYQFAHTSDENIRKESLTKIKKLIVEGIRPPRWNPEENVKRATKDGHPLPELLKKLSEVISNNADEKELDKFEVWRNIR